MRENMHSLRKNSVSYLRALENEAEHLAYSHIDADGLLRKTSFDKVGYKISECGVIKSFKKLCNAEERIL